MKKENRILIAALLTLLLSLSILSPVAFAEGAIASQIFSGEETDILTGIEITNAPVRVVFDTEKDADFTFSYILGGSDRRLFGDADSPVGVLLKDGTYDFLIECNKPWMLLLEPLTSTEETSFAGIDGFVSDIFTLNKATIAKIDGKFAGYENFLVYFYTLGKSSWSYDTVCNDLAKDKAISLKSILKVTGETKCFFVIDFIDGEWSIELQ